MKRASLVAAVAVLAGAATAPPVFAQISLSGEWQAVYHEDQEDRIPGPQLGDYTGLPLTAEARAYADAWSPSQLTLPEQQCRAHTAAYIMRGPAGGVRIWDETDPTTQEVVAIKIFINTYAQERTIYMDGRPHPSVYAAHTWQGFSTGRWNGDQLTVTTTHIKQGWVRRNGVPHSADVKLTEQFIRHGDVLTNVSIVEDPAYLTEPLIRSQDFVRMERRQPGVYQGWVTCQPDDEIDRPKGVVPFYLPGTNKDVDEFQAHAHLPAGPARGGSETLYPEYQDVLRKGGARVTTEHALPSSRVRQQPAPEPGVQVLAVQRDVYMVAGGGANVTVAAGDQGLVVIDSGTTALSGEILSAIRRISKKPIRYVINTSIDADHTGGNETIGLKGGGSIPSRNAATDGAIVIAREDVLKRMSEPAAAVPSALWPSSTYFTSQKDLFLNGTAIQILHQPRAHTDGDSMVYLRVADVVATGDLFRTTGYPVIDERRGGSIDGVVDGLNRLLDLMVAGEKEEGGTMVVPGHGRICDEADVVEYRDMVTIIRARVQDLIKKGRTLEAIKAARPTFDYDPVYGHDPAWTPDMFVEAIYRGLTARAAKSR